MRRAILAVGLWALLGGTGEAAEGLPNPMEQAATRVQGYLQSVPGLPKNILVVPATGEVLWPGSPPSANERAEVWVVVPRDKPDAKPLMMFAVRPATGEVYAMFLSDLKTHPRYR
ncbi:MAG: hypothetical protein VKP62_03035 [Candidatus Sericytochromatia bacterium]|nr:hypothetical protein [Candidatus Sericytochromatia bacterium]